MPACDLALLTQLMYRTVRTLNFKKITKLKDLLCEFR